MIYKPTQKPPHNRKLLREAVLLVAFYLVMQVVAPRFLVEGPSMEPTFQGDQRIVASPIPYLISQPERGDIVVFHSPMLNSSGVPLIKRVIGLPGEMVEFKGEQLYIDGGLIQEPYINEPCRPANCPDAKFWVGPDQFFMMGDNRNHSNDSRTFGPILRKGIIGEALLRFWPPQDWGLLKQIRYKGDDQ